MSSVGTSCAVIVMNFSGVYDHERFASGPRIVQIDCRHLDGTDCYCDEQGAAEIRQLIAPYPPEGIHFIDNGNHHYVTGFWMEKIREPFSLIVFDHHPDVQAPAWGPGLLSCGGWIANEIVRNPNLRNVLVVGPSQELIESVLPSIRHRVKFFGERDVDAHPDWVRFSEEHIDTPVYISIDKDVLSPQTVRTNWDQGHLGFGALQSHLRAILAHERVIGVDICGECSVLLDFAEEEKATSQNDFVNTRLLALIKNGLPQKKANQ